MLTAPLDKSGDNYSFYIENMLKLVKIRKYNKITLR